MNPFSFTIATSIPEVERVKRNFFLGVPGPILSFSYTWCLIHRPMGEGGSRGPKWILSSIKPSRGNADIQPSLCACAQSREGRLTSVGLGWLSPLFSCLHLPGLLMAKYSLKLSLPRGESRSCRQLASQLALPVRMWLIWVMLVWYSSLICHRWLRQSLTFTEDTVHEMVSSKNSCMCFPKSPDHH